MSIAQIDVSGNPLALRDFLRALYSGAPDELYFELRCIHPTSGDARSLWSKVGDKRTLTNALNRATALNCESGYGLYFAPCLRSQKQGKAEVAALLPALWVDLDCDDDAARRAEALAKLHTFSPPPSAIIDSGGGLHAYWLLKEATSLIDEADRKQAAGILRGLFSVLGGDPQYVKSVASVMRLPNSLNTKPDRGGVIVTLLELHPDRRYPLSDFAWLESQPRVERIGSLNVVTLDGNGQHPLPKRTADYLVSGATEGNRNTELFQAACQLRDAGHVQSEAEAQLVPRYVADGSSEKEALATIRSAYSRPPRDPLPNPREQVEQLISRYGRQTQPVERPTAEQIREVVEACATLDPLAWAAERKQLRELCGDTYRVEDLNNMYREARRALQKDERPLLPDNRYLEVDGRMVFERTTERGTVAQSVADWVGRVQEWVTRVDDGAAEHIMRLELRRAGQVVTIDVPSELFGDTNALQRFVAAKAGGLFTVEAGMHRHLVRAILALSGEPKRKTTFRFLGWTEMDGKWSYVSPQVSINADGCLALPPEVELETRLRDYRLQSIDWERAITAFQAVISVFPKPLAPMLLAFSLLPLVQRFFPAAAMKPALHLVGTSGSGKSEIAALMTSFYGNFSRDTPPAQWGDTINTVEVLGYALADALFWVDDYKTSYADERTFTRFLQSYSRGMGRGRLTREATLRQDRPCRGLLLSTGETTIEGEASVLSRMLLLEIPPWEHRDPQGRALAQADTLRADLPGFTAHFAAWIARQADAGTLRKDLADDLDLATRGYREKLSGARQAHTGRVIGNWAVLLTTYRLVMRFLVEKDADQSLPPWQDAIYETVRAVQHERAGRLFLDTLAQLLASGEVLLATDMREPEEARPGVTVIGYEDREFVYLIPEVAYREVNRILALKFTISAIGSQLKEDNVLIPASSDGHLTVQMRVRGHRTRLWRLRAAVFSGDGGDNGDGAVH
ncbi:MAG: DUF927 domain-containing protein [Chloroflexi bacterium]|nr:DUF927 domain-containing protein [Chloroflexota bacterium]